MVNVLVGGKRREEVLEQRLYQLKFGTPLEKESCPPSISQIRPYHDVEWEVYADAKNPQFDPQGSKQAPFHFNNSKEMLVSRGFYRHPYAREALTLLLDGTTENKLKPSLQMVYENIRNRGFGEWTDTVMMRAKDTIICYEKVQDLTWNTTHSRYTIPPGGIRASNRQEFKIGRLARQETALLSALPEALLVYLFDTDLTLITKSAIHHAFRIPGTTPWPVSIDPDGSIQTKAVRAASRGVRPRFPPEIKA